MKYLQYISATVLLCLTSISCNNFLTFSPSDQLPDDQAFRTANDIQNGVNGLYNLFGNYEFAGRNVIALGDMASDNAWMQGTSGHFDNIYRFNYSEETADLMDIWEKGLEVANAAAKVIKYAPIVSESATSDEQRTQIKTNLAEAHLMKAICNFYLVNIFGPVYSDENKDKDAIILIKDEPVVAFQAVERSSVGAVYEHILYDIAKAKEYFSSDSFEAFTLNTTSLYAFEARVYLYMKDWSAAITSAKKAMDLRKGAIVTDAKVYAEMWASVSPTTEDIFTIGKLPDDNLSANSLNTLYGTYNGKLLPGLVKMFAANDMRQALIAGTATLPEGLKYQGLSDSKATSNIPILRLPELYLIIAEAMAQQGEADAVTYLYEVAKRNPDLKKADIPTAKADLLQFIADERRRELFQEGHRLFDARRTGEKMTREGGIAVYKDWDSSAFVYPIPANEINASGITQNTNWKTVLPTIITN